MLVILLFISRANTGGTSRIIFGIFNLQLSIYFAFNLLYRLKALHALAYLYYPILPVILCFIPTFYLYILSITCNNFRISVKHAVHFLPAVLVLMMNTPFLFLPFAQKIQFLSFTSGSLQSNPLILYLIVIYIITIYLVINIQLVIYLVLSIRQYRNHLLFIEDHYSYTEQIDTAWTRSFMISFLFFFIINNLLYVIGFRQNHLAGILYTGSMLGITLFAGVRGMNQKEISVSGDTEEEKLFPFSLGTGESMNSELPEEKGEGISHAVKYQGSSLTDEQKQFLAERLESLMQNEKVFTQSNLTIDHLAQRLETNSKYISQIINEFYHQNYFHYINSYRINEAKTLLSSPATGKYSILGISGMAGFASKSTFNTAFKKFTGMTPSEFKEHGDKSAI